MDLVSCDTVFQSIYERGRVFLFTFCITYTNTSFKHVGFCQKSTKRFYLYVVVFVCFSQIRGIFSLVIILTVGLILLGHWVRYCKCSLPVWSRRSLVYNRFIARPKKAGLQL